jgi:hypothetical protein
VTRRLRAGGLRGLFDSAQTLRCKQTSTSSVKVARLIRWFSWAESLFPILRERDCLPRSFALYHYLRYNDVSACHVIGITPSPFAAHAWVEMAGLPILDSPSVTKRFAVISHIAP